MILLLLFISLVIPSPLQSFAKESNGETLTLIDQDDEDEDVEVEETKAEGALTEDVVDKLLEQYRADSNSWKRDFETEVLEIKKLLLEPNQITNEDFETMLRDLAKKLSEDDGNGLPSSLLDVYTASESLQIILDHRKAATSLNKELDRILSKRGFLQNQEVVYMQLPGRLYEFEALTTSVETLVLKIRVGGTTTGMGPVLRDIANLMTKLGRDFNYFLDLGPKKIMDTDGIGAFLDQRQRIIEGFQKYHSMNKEYIKGMMGFKASTGLELDGNASSLGYDVIQKEGLDMDVTVMEDLLKTYQRLEGLKNNWMVEKEVARRFQIEEEIKLVEENIPIFIKKNKVEIEQFGPSTFGVINKCYKKMISMNLLLQGLQEQMTKAEDALIRLTDVLEKYEDVKGMADSLLFGGRKWKYGNDEL